MVCVLFGEATHSDDAQGHAWLSGDNGSSRDQICFSSQSTLNCTIFLVPKVNSDTLSVNTTMSMI